MCGTAFEHCREQYEHTGNELYAAAKCPIAKRSVLMPKEGEGIHSLCDERNPSSCRAIVVGRTRCGDLRLNLSEVILILGIVDVD